MDFNTETFSLTLKNMQKTDSGVYTSQITGRINRVIAVHTVSVIGEFTVLLHFKFPYFIMYSSVVQSVTQKCINITFILCYKR